MVMNQGRRLKRNILSNYNKLQIILSNRKSCEGPIPLHERAIVLNNVGVPLFDSGRFTEAYINFNGALILLLDKHIENDDRDLQCVYHPRSKYDEGITIAPNAIAINENNTDKSSASDEYASFITSVILFNLGNIHQRKDELDEALVFYQRALTYAERISNPRLHEVDVFLSILHNIGEIHYVKENHNLALQVYSEALYVAKETFGDMHLKVASSLNCIGVTLYQLSQGQDEKVIYVFQRALEIMKLLGSDHCDIATVLNNIGRSYFRNDKYDDALKAYKKSLHMRRHLHGNFHHDVGATLFNTGQVCHEKGMYDNALDSYLECLEIAKCSIGSKNVEVAIIMSSIGQVYQRKNNFDQALIYYTKTLCIEKTVLGEEHPQIAASLNRLGNLLSEKGEVDQAITIYRQELDIEKKTLAIDHPNTVVTLSNIGEMYLLNKQYQNALDMFEEAVDLLKSTSSQGHPSFVFVLHRIACILCKKELYEQALETYHEVLAMSSKLRDKHLLAVVSNMVHIGVTLLDRDMLELALKALIGSFRVHKMILNSFDRDIALSLYSFVADNLNKLGLIYFESGDIENMMLAFTEATRICREIGLNPDNLGCTPQESLCILSIEYPGGAAAA